MNSNMWTNVRALTVTLAMLLGFPAWAQTNFTMLHHFIINGTDGAASFGGLVEDTNGIFYGTTFAGGTVSNWGTIFSIKPDGTGYRILHDFDKTNGSGPYANLIIGTNGSLFGTTYAGGISNFGTVFTMNRDGSGFQTLHSFTGSTDGKTPEGAVLQADTGVLFGTTYTGDSVTRGTIFKINPDGSGYTVVHAFPGAPDGQNPECNLMEASYHVIYGTTVFGGSHNGGTVFLMNNDGSGYQVIYNFRASSTDGYEPGSGLIQGSDGMLYGTTYVGGGTGTNGTIFTMNSVASVYQIIHGFSTTADGQRPNSQLMQGSDGLLYGVTDYGSANYNGGCAFKLAKDGSGYVPLKAFYGAYGDASIPRCTLLQFSNGVIFGTSEYGSQNGDGCIFALSTNPVPSLANSLAKFASSNLVQFTVTAFAHYDVQRSTNLSGWSTLTTLTGPTNCILNYSDTVPPQAATVYYKLYQH